MSPSTPDIIPARPAEAAPTRSARLRPRLAVLALALTAALGVYGQTAQPRLVLQVLVEGLTGEQLDLLAPVLADDGFRRLMADDALRVERLDYGPGLDAVAATAVLQTGASPAVNGVDHATRYLPHGRRVVAALRDSALSVGRTEGVLSPAALAVTTVADELAIAQGGTGRVYALGGEGQAAVLAAGHAGDGAYWVSDISGAWAGTPYYTAPAPAAVGARNMGTSALKSRLDTVKWTPLLDPAAYPGIPAYKAAYPFRHVFTRDARDRYRAFRASPKGNTEATDMAEAVIAGLGEAPGGATDMVTVVYTLAPYPYSRDADPRLETLDAVVRLDRDLARLMRAVDSHGPGMDRTIVALAALPAPASSRRDEERFRVPYGEFSVRRARSLLNMYLMALHGEGDWVEAWHNGAFHLNRQLIRSRGLEVADVRREAADFLARMAGVSGSYTVDDVTGRRLGDVSDALLRNMRPASAPDVFVTVNPGWEVTDADDPAGADPTPRPSVCRLGAADLPAFIVGPGVTPGLMTAPVDARAFAPTLARALRIRAPNAAALPPLRP